MPSIGGQDQEIRNIINLREDNLRVFGVQRILGIKATSWRETDALTQTEDLTDATEPKE